MGIKRGMEGLEGDEKGHVQSRKVQYNERQTHDTRQFKTHTL